MKEVITDGQTGPRAMVLALISSIAFNLWANKKVQGFSWFEQPTGHNQKLIQHNSPQMAQLAERVAHWNVVYLVVEEELRRQNISLISQCS